MAVAPWYEWSDDSGTFNLVNAPDSSETIFLYSPQEFRAVIDSDAVLSIDDYSTDYYVFGTQNDSSSNILLYNEIGVIQSIPTTSAAASGASQNWFG